MFKFLSPPATSGKVATFYMKGGRVVTTDNVKSVELKHDISTGGFEGCTIEWEDTGPTPSVFSLSIADIIAVKVG